MNTVLAADSSVGTHTSIYLCTYVLFFYKHTACVYCESISVKIAMIQGPQNRQTNNIKRSLTLHKNLACTYILAALA